MTIALVAIADGRDTIHARAWESAERNLPFDRFDEIIQIDDADHRLGFAGAIREAWEQVDADWVFHLELDFTFNEPVDVHGMVGLLEASPRLAQVSLKRQAWNGHELAAGGIVEHSPHDFTEMHAGPWTWTEHRRYFTTNPSVYSARLCRTGWPQEPSSEGLFTARLLRDPLLRFALWGGKHDPPKIHHIGQTRAGHGY